MALQVFIERKGSNRIRVDWSTPNRLEWGEALLKLKTIPGKNYSRTGNYHTLPLDFQVCQELRKLYGSALVIGPELHSWAVNAKRKIESLGTMALSDTATLVNLPTRNPALYRALYVGPLAKDMTPAQQDAAMAAATSGSYQTADVAFMVTSDAPLNGNHPGTGKTPTTIGALYEGGWYSGIGLVVAPKVAVDSVWEVEFERWAPDVKAFACIGKKPKRQATIAAFMAHQGPKVLIVNPQMIQYDKKFLCSMAYLKTLDVPGLKVWLEHYGIDGKQFKGADALDDARRAIFTADQAAGVKDVVFKCKPKEEGKCCNCDALKDWHWHYEPTYPELFQVRWDYIVNDEVHKGSIRNHRSLTSRSISDLRTQPNCKRIALSGTPMKKGGPDIWGILHWLRPKVFTSYWNFVERFFDVEHGDYGRKVGKLRPDKKEEFYNYLTPYMLRRTKAECAPWLPDKFYIDVLCSMTDRQRTQYDKMQADGAVNISGVDIATTGILAEFTRLRQFANAYCEMRNGKVVPTMDSGKIEKLWELLEERGVFDNLREEKVIIFSQFEELVTLIHVGLRAEGVDAVRLTGKENKDGQRKAIQEAFQASGGPKVIVMTTTAGGVAITLDAADTVIFMDETWSPDDMEQAEDRAHRTSKIHQVTIYVLRSKDSIDSYVHDICADKAYSHAEILDVRRAVLAASQNPKTAKAA